MDLKTWLLSRNGVLIVSVLLTLIVLAESLLPPWAPFFVIYAVLAICIPLALKTYRFGRFRTVMASAWLLTLAIFVLDVIWDQGMWGWLYPRVLDGFGVGADPFWSVDAAMEAMLQKTVPDLGVSLETSQMLLAFFMLIWAPIGEELFYRGYVYGTLRKRHSFWAAALISAAFFGVRHATHFFYLWPQVPWAAAGAWAVSTFGYGMYISYLYEKTDSLYPPILEHVLINIVWAVAAL